MEGEAPKTGGLKVKIGSEDVCLLRKRVLESLKEEGGKTRSFAKIAEILKPEFPQVADKTLTDYCRIVGQVPDKVFDLYKSGTISFTVLTEFGQTNLSSGDIEYIASEYIDLGMNMPQLRKVKNILRTYGAKMSVREAIDRATGKISAFAKPDAVKKIIRDFDGLLDEVLKHATMFRIKVSQLIDMLPVSTLDKGRVHSELFNKVYMLRHILGEQYGFVDGKVKTYLDELVRFVATESQLNELRKQEAYSAQHGSGDHGVGREEAQDVEVHDPRPVLQDPAGERPGEGRVEA